MGDFDWRSLVKPTRADMGLDIGPLPLAAAAAEPAPPLRVAPRVVELPKPPPSSAGVETTPLSSRSPSLGVRTQVSRRFSVKRRGPP